MDRRTLLSVVAARLPWVAVLCVVGIIAELVGVSQQDPIQRGIDAHTVVVSGTFVALVHGSTTYSDDTYIVSFLYDGRLVQARLRSLPGHLNRGDSVCLEVDATQPEHGRVCGTRGGLDDARRGLTIGSAIMAALLLTVSLAAWQYGRRDEADLIGETIAGSSTGQRTVDRPSLRGNLLLRPAPATRWTMAILFGGVFAVVGLMMRADSTYRDAVTLPLLLLALGALVAIRCLQVGVLCAGGMVTVHGLLITRHIPAAQVTAVAFDDDFWDRPTIDWQDQSGKRRRAHLKWFSVDARGLDSVREFHMSQVKKLKAWIRLYQRSDPI
jgi:hypothetical protein